MLFYAITALVAFILGILTAAIFSSRTSAHLRYEKGMLQGELKQTQDELMRMRNDLENEKKRQADISEHNTTERFERLKQEITTIPEKVLSNRQTQLEESGRRQLGNIADPLLTEIKRMQQIIDKAGHEHSASMERLDAAIRANLTQTEGIGRTADRLAQALTGENKTQGNFGELRLKQLLDDMGFQEGLQYEQQVFIKDQQGRPVKDGDGHKLQPDLVLHFPDHRDLVIDSKVSLAAFEDYFNTTDPEERKSALRRHIASVRAHVIELARKDYSRYLGQNSADFVVMYVFSESALQLALTGDPNLYREAYNRRVIICSSNNLYALLRLLETSWKQMERLHNEQELMAAANSVVERVQIFQEHFLKIEDSLASAQKAVESVKAITAQRGRSIITAARKMIKYGAVENMRHKSLPKEDADSAVEDVLPEK